jgi:hypothetical protein
MAWSSEELEAEVSSPDRGLKVVEVLRSYFSQGRRLLEPARLIDASVDVDSDGCPVLVAVYGHPYYQGRIGLRHRLDQYPMSMPEGNSPAEAMAQDIAVFEISEPLGSYYDHVKRTTLYLMVLQLNSIRPRKSRPVQGVRLFFDVWQLIRNTSSLSAELGFLSTASSRQP